VSCCPHALLPFCRRPTWTPWRRPARILSVHRKQVTCGVRPGRARGRLRPAYLSFCASKNLKIRNGRTWPASSADASRIRTSPERQPIHTRQAEPSSTQTLLRRSSYRHHPGIALTADIVYDSGRRTHRFFSICTHARTPAVSLINVRGPRHGRGIMILWPVVAPPVSSYRWLPTWEG